MHELPLFTGSDSPGWRTIPYAPHVHSCCWSLTCRSYYECQAIWFFPFFWVHNNSGPSFIFSFISRSISAHLLPVLVVQVRPLLVLLNMSVSFPSPVLVLSMKWGWFFYPQLASSFSLFRANLLLCFFSHPLEKIAMLRILWPRRYP